MKSFTEAELQEAILKIKIENPNYAREKAYNYALERLLTVLGLPLV